MLREFRDACVTCLTTFLLAAVAYPAIVWGVAQAAFPRQAEGSLIVDSEGTLLGSELIAQAFTSDIYFHPRPSAVDYKADAPGGSNLGPNHPALRKRAEVAVSSLKATDENPVPVDMVTTSGGGLDPHLSPAAARFQSARVAKARGLSEAEVRIIIDGMIERSVGILGAPDRVNVLKLNRILDDRRARTSR